MQNTGGDVTVAAGVAPKYHLYGAFEGSTHSDLGYSVQTQIKLSMTFQICVLFCQERTLGKEGAHAILSWI